MRLPDVDHTSRPWRIHAIAPEFRLEDVWALPTPGGPDDFPDLLACMAVGDPTADGPLPVRALWALRRKLGELLGWDDPQDGLGGRVRSLRDRLPDDLRGTPLPDTGALPFASLYLTEDEWAGEIANATMHGVMHLGWVEDPATGGYRGQMAVLVKPNGLRGDLYMAAIKPFRYTLVYPALLGRVEALWNAGADARHPASRGVHV